MSGKGKRNATRWSLDQLVGYECALAKDESEDWQSLKAQDAETHLEEGLLLSGDRRAIAAGWLKLRLEASPEIKLASDSVMQSLKAAGQLLGAGGLLLGLASATAALAYTGEAPINVSAFFSLFVLLQAVLAVVLLLVFAAPRSWRERLAFGPLFRATRWILESIFSKLQALSARFLSGQQRQDAAEWAGAARRSLALHGSVAKWLAFTKIQAAALCFNFGVLAALLVSVVFSDRAFGWQTTLETESESVGQLVEVVSLPWAWAYGEGEGYPSLQQIEGSRIVLKEGTRGLESVDLAAWWRFLALGVLSYGVLPRLIFYFLGKWQIRASLARYDFGNASAERLMQRLRPEGPRFDAERVEQGAEQIASGVGGVDLQATTRQRVLCLCSRELGESFDLEALRTRLAQRWGVRQESVEVKTYENGRIAAAAADLSEERQFVIVFESWMPPIREIERQVRELRAQMDERNLLKIVLLGIPDSAGEAISLRPEKQYAEAWHSFVQRLGDPYLILDNPAL
ncbi:DUF2868 domain-containing protein [Pelagicoccus sp. SDUM812002]|uniref:DUF2868 domain-containing protein n=1 Tax=Pelagicoccus sp. SDUM812002 TaxID=3041266 RepID=UPI00280C4D49|nr:DUF2868 domain-containing protein [Pelagicoccus sp. SDUM812002]MDQ8184981.1 DUF2868 domain-containing protein [Pelagicoccus sp. SDUM812002]